MAIWTDPPSFDKCGIKLVSLAQKESNVIILILFMAVIKFQLYFSSLILTLHASSHRSYLSGLSLLGIGLELYASNKADFILCNISFAALLVNVIAKISSGEFTAWANRFSTLDIKICVLPDPAGACTIKDLVVSRAFLR